MEGEKGFGTGFRSSAWMERAGSSGVRLEGSTGNAETALQKGEIGKEWEKTGKLSRSLMKMPVRSSPRKFSRERWSRCGKPRSFFKGAKAR
ncbi:MAG: hypothetical protein ACLR2E_06660 [Lachnospiraceae bacterium]